MRLDHPRFDTFSESGGSTGFTFPKPVPISHLRKSATSAVEWVWDGFLPRRGIVLFLGMWKAGKTTFLSHLFGAIGRGETEFCGRSLQPTKVLMVTQEPDPLWNERQEKLGLTDQIHFQRGPDNYPQPFCLAPSRSEWEAFTTHLKRSVQEDDYGLVVLDTLAEFWPVEDENSGSEVNSALRPLRQVSHAGACVLLVHHPRKSEGSIETASRGSGAFPAAADIILQLTNPRPKQPENTVRKLTAKGRFSETPRELVVRLTAEGFVLHDGSVRSVQPKVKAAECQFPTKPPGITAKEWAEQLARIGKALSDRQVRSVLNKEWAEGKLRREGRGTKNDPHRYWRK